MVCGDSSEGIGRGDEPGDVGEARGGAKAIKQGSTLRARAPAVLCEGAQLSVEG